MLCCLCVVIILFVLYKVLDLLIRIPKIGKYGDRYILVTGCDTGFGNLLAKRLDRLGCHVFAGCLTEKGEIELKKSCSERLHSISLDVSKPESVRKALEYVKSKLPEGRGLWGLMNNAGIVHKLGPPDWMNLDDYRHVSSVNLYGLIDVTMTFLSLVKKERGRIVSTSSIFGRLSPPVYVPYTVSKYGVEAFVDGLRRSLIPFHCQASLIEPGLHMTPMCNPDSLIVSYRKAWTETSPEVRAEYGEDYFNYISGKGLENFIAKCGSKKLSDVVDAYEHALLGCFPRIRYVVGKDAKFIWVPILSLPACLGDWLLSKLDPEQPLPQAARN